MGSSMKPDSPRRAVLTALGKDSAQTHPQIVLTGDKPCFLSLPFNSYLSLSQQQLACRVPPQTTLVEEMEESSGPREQEGGREQQFPPASSWRQSEVVCLPVWKVNIFCKATQGISLLQIWISLSWESIWDYASPSENRAEGHLKVSKTNTLSQNVLSPARRMVVPGALETAVI